MCLLTQIYNCCFIQLSFKLGEKSYKQKIHLTVFYFYLWLSFSALSFLHVDASYCSALSLQSEELHFVFLVDSLGYRRELFIRDVLNKMHR